ncbi:DUF2125 domain-containing protein [Aestuariivirga sp.]|uniref:DUF2125 domain-containing protein n=1 Tax=Aestuariivirga sp. TaxID=2650926 RepID=UPI0025C2E2F0|nr:DUF2125 domain-containing protein [Aestuariivirga sp.]MCA3554273.1 DUF2125 domain-containing protein [Aestuariivirga sp.]
MFLPLAIVLALALLWSVCWFIASGIAKQRFAATRANLAAQGLTLACGEESWGGYPFHFEFTCPSPKLSWNGSFELHAAHLLMVTLAYAPWQIAALVDGPTMLRGPVTATTEIKHQRALAAVTFGRDGQPSFSAELPAASAAGVGQAGKLMLFTRPSVAGATEIAFDASQVTFQPTGKPPVTLDTATLRGTLNADRSLRIDKIELQQGQLRCWGSGTLTLEPEHRVSGRIDAETNDIRALLAAAGPQLGLSDSQLANLRMMLGLLGNDARVPIIARDGVLYLGPFEVTELKPLY